MTERKPKSQDQLRREAEARLAEFDQIAAMIAAWREKWGVKCN